MKIEDRIKHRLKTRLCGFWFWTTKKNFLTVHYLKDFCKPCSDRCGSVSVLYETGLSIFRIIMEEIRQEGNVKRHKEVLQKWHRARLPQIDRCDAKQFLNFLYGHKISAEELYVYLDTPLCAEFLWWKTLKAFSVEEELIDEDNSHVSKIYMQTVAFPRRSLCTPSLIANGWNALLSYAGTLSQGWGK